MKAIEIPTSGAVHATVRPPGSKSITNRALPCAAVAEGETTLTGLLDSEDTRVMLDALDKLGVQVTLNSDRTVAHIVGLGGAPKVADVQNPLDLFVANSGTSVRFLTALCAAGQGTFHFDGIQRMRERPISDLLAGLEQLGAEADSPTGCPPVTIRANGLAGGRATVAGNISSQFLSGLLMAAPLAQSPVELVVDGDLVSKPYIEMTLAVMQSFGVEVEASSQLDRFLIPSPCNYQAKSYAIEPDASAASYFFAMAPITGGTVTVEGLSQNSLQGDVKFCDCLRQMGCDVTYQSDQITVVGHPPRGIDVDMNAISDTVQTLAVVALFADGPTRIRNVAHIRHKETDRISAVATELRKLGATVEETDSDLTIHPGPPRPASIDTYNDHRMAMSFALAGLRIPGVTINNPNCVEKTYPKFFEDLSKLVSS
ncbi:MAG: 3-phosphoshikimate 1-carboxyvinyltransferase [Planctomycetia bacterium]|jgi:3-phosphoshikimate 1-carboxyvinyltransferase